MCHYLSVDKLLLQRVVQDDLGRPDLGERQRGRLDSVVVGGVPLEPRIEPAETHPAVSAESARFEVEVERTHCQGHVDECAVERVRGRKLGGLVLVEAEREVAEQSDLGL